MLGRGSRGTSYGGRCGGTVPRRCRGYYNGWSIWPGETGIQDAHLPGYCREVNDDTGALKWDHAHDPERTWETPAFGRQIIINKFPGPSAKCHVALLVIVESLIPVLVSRPILVGTRRMSARWIEAYKYHDGFLVNSLDAS